MLLVLSLLALILSPAEGLPVLSNDQILPLGNIIPKDSNQNLERQIFDLTEMRPTTMIDEHKTLSRLKRDIPNYLSTSSNNETTEEVSLEFITTTPSSILDEDEFEEKLVKEIVKTILHHVYYFMNQIKPYEDELDFSKFSILLDMFVTGTYKDLDQVSDPKLLDYIIQNTDFDLHVQKEIMRAVLTYKKALGPPPEPSIRLPGFGKILFRKNLHVPYLNRNENVPRIVTSPPEDE